MIDVQWSAAPCAMSPARQLAESGLRQLVEELWDGLESLWTLDPPCLDKHYVYVLLNTQCHRRCPVLYDPVTDTFTIQRHFTYPDYKSRVSGLCSSKYNRHLLRMERARPKDGTRVSSERSLEVEDRFGRCP